MNELDFVKLYNIGDNQVLFIKDYDNEDDLFTINQITNLDGCRPSLLIKFENEESCNDYFFNINQNYAEEFLNGMKKMLS